MSDTSFIYVVGAGPVSKVGTSANPKNRVKSLQNNNPYKCELVKMYPVASASAFEIEQRCLKKLSSTFSHYGEWFHAPHNEVIRELDIVLVGVVNTESLSVEINTKIDTIRDETLMLSSQLNDFELTSLLLRRSLKRALDDRLSTVEKMKDEAVDKGVPHRSINDSELEKTSLTQVYTEFYSFEYVGDGRFNAYGNKTYDTRTLGWIQSHVVRRYFEWEFEWCVPDSKSGKAGKSKTLIDAFLLMDEVIRETWR